MYISALNVLVKSTLSCETVSRLTEQGGNKRLVKIGVAYKSANQGGMVYNNGAGDPDKPSLEDMKNNPPNVLGYTPPKSGDRKVRNPNGRGTGWVDRNGRVWVPDNHDGTHAPHWDVQNPKGGGYTPVYPFAQPGVEPSSRFSWPSFNINPTVLKVGIIIGVGALIIVTDGAAAPLLAL